MRGRNREPFHQLVVRLCELMVPLMNECFLLPAKRNRFKSKFGVLSVLAAISFVCRLVSVFDLFRIRNINL